MLQTSTRFRLSHREFCNTKLLGLQSSKDRFVWRYLRKFAISDFLLGLFQVISSFGRRVQLDASVVVVDVTGCQTLPPARAAGGD